MKRFTLAILLGWLLLGSVVPAFAAAGDVPPRPLTDQGLTNLTALTRLIGYVRFFHPSDQAAGLANADWDALAMAGAERVEAARNPRELAAALSTLLPTIAPTVRVLPFSLPGKSAVQAPEDTGDGGPVRWLAWHHEGVYLHTPFTSFRSARVEIGRVPDGASADVSQELDVERLRGHRVRLSAAVRFTAGAAGSAALNLNASTAGGSGSAAWSQPILRGGWRRVTIETDVPADAFFLILSFDLTGSGRLTFDDVKATADGVDVTGHLMNPDLEEVVPGMPPHGWMLSAAPFGAVYSLNSVTGAAAGHWAAEISGPQVRPVALPLVEDLGGGVSALVPVALPADDQGTFPHLPQPTVPPVPDKPAGFVPSGLDRTTRLAGVMVSWSVFQHFYPYFDQVGADWPGALRRGLTSAAVDPDEASYLRTLRRLLVELEEAEASVAGDHGVPRGELSITASQMFGRIHVAPLVQDFLSLYPQVSARLLLLDRVANLIDEGFDLAVRIAHLQDSSLRAIRVGHVRRVVVASPDYLAQHGTPKQPGDLRQHRAVMFTAGMAVDEWVFRDNIQIAPPARFYVNSSEVAIGAAIAGQGLTRVLSYMVAPALASGAVKIILADYELPPVPVQLVHAEGRRASATLRAFLDFAAERLRAEPVLQN